MFDRLRSRLHDMRTVSALLRTAERIARAGGDERPGAEHALLAALELPDGSARRVFERLGVDPASVPGAIEAQHLDALDSIGVPRASGAAVARTGSPLPPPEGGYAAEPSLTNLMRSAANADAAREGPLRGVHFLDALARTEHGVCARTLRRLGIAPEALRAAVAAESGSPRASRDDPSTGTSGP